MNIPYKAGSRVRITSSFGYRTDPISGEEGTFHGGLDLVGLDSKNLYAPVGGVVLVSQMVTDKANRTWEWGNYICISGDDGNLYYLCHMARRSVNVGERVEEGELIGIEGSTGYSTGSHCHFEVRDKNNKQLNPAELLGIPNVAGEVITVNENVITDNGSVGDSTPAEWSREAVKWATKNGILQGNENGDLMLRQTATREQIVTMLHRLYTQIKNEF